MAIKQKTGCVYHCGKSNCKENMVHQPHYNMAGSREKASTLTVRLTPI